MDTVSIPDYKITDDINKIDFNKTTDMLSKSYWSPGIKQHEIIKGAKNSAVVVGVFNNSNEQIGYARVISDKTRFAYILDVYVDEEYRKKGICQSIIDFILTHPDLNDVYQWVLITKDAQGVYSKKGFKPLESPESWMEIRNPRPGR